MTSIRDLHKAWMKEPNYRREYDLLEEEFALAAAVAKARRAKPSRVGAAYEDDSEHNCQT